MCKKLLIIGLVFSLASCKKFLEVDPPKNQLIGDIVFGNEATVDAAMVGIYSNLSTTEFGIANSGITMYCGMAADEFINESFSAYRGEFFTNSISVSNTAIQLLWNEAYRNIYAANAVIEGISSGATLPEEFRNKIEGEARFIRAFLYYYLFKMFGDVPLALTTDYVYNATVNRSGTDSVLYQITDDLDKSYQLFSTINLSGNKVRPGMWAAKTLLSRVYLACGNWEKAEQAATAVINSGEYMLEQDLNNVFVKNSNEAIWQLMPVMSDRNTNEGFYFILNGFPEYISLTQNLVEGFEPADLRRETWVRDTLIETSRYYYPFKYKVQSGSELLEYTNVLRLAEVYLIRAEARNNLGKTSDAIQDLNLIRQRAALPDIMSNERNVIDSAIIHERRIEFFAEWGHRWFDLKRKQLAGATLGPIKGNTWNETDTLFPIPLQQLLNNPAMRQNPGY